MDKAEHTVLQLARERAVNELLRIDDLQRRVSKRVMKLIHHFAKEEAREGIAQMLQLQRAKPELGGFSMTITTSDDRWTFDVNFLDAPLRFVGTGGSFEEAWARAKQPTA